MMLGAVLAGGKASRFGSDKADALWRGIALVDHVAGALAAVSTQVIVCGRPHPRLPSVPDRPVAGLGPLGGLSAAFGFARARGFDYVITAPCDTPLLDEQLLRELAAGRGNAYLAEMPVIGRWRSADGAALDDYLASGARRSVRSWAHIIGATPVDARAPVNINYLADLEALDGE